MRLSRRAWLKALAAQLATPAVIPALAACGPPPPPAWSVLALRAASCFEPEDIAGARAIGAAFLDQVGRDEALLEGELAPTLVLLEVEPAECDAAIDADFAAREVRFVEGWTIAATEAHLCALLELFEVV